MRLNVIQPQPIVHLHLDLTNHCNFRCEFCFQYGDLTAKRGFMDTDLALRLIDEVAEDGLATGLATSVFGEALLHPDFFRIAHHAVERGLEVTLNTKGGLLDVATSERIASSGIHKLIISLNTPDEASWKTNHAPEKLTYDAHLAKIREAIDWKLRVQSSLKIYIYLMNTFFARPRGLAYIADDDAARAAVGAWRDVCAELANEHGVAPPPELDELCGRELVHRKWPIDRGLVLLDGVELVLKEAHSFGNRILDPDLEPMPTETGYCSLPWEMLTVHWNGDCSLCCLDYNRDLVIGNVTHATLKQVFSGDEIEAIRNDFTAGRVTQSVCQTCLGGLRSKSTGEVVRRPQSSRANHALNSLRKYGVYRSLRYGWDTLKERVGR